MAPPLFGDLYKTSNELFVKDYSSFAPKLEVSANILNGVPAKCTFTQAGDAFKTEIELKKKAYDIDFTSKVDSKGALTLVAENTTHVPNLKWKAEHTLRAATKVTAEYKVKEVSASASFDVAKSSADLSVVGQISSLLIGASTSYAKKFTTPVIKAQYNGEGYEVGAHVTDLGAKFGVSLYQNINSNVSLGVNAEQAGSDLALAVGGSFTPDKDTTVRGKIDSKGNIFTMYNQKLSALTTLKLLGKVDTNKLSDGAAHQFGVNVVVKA